MSTESSTPVQSATSTTATAPSENIAIPGDDEYSVVEEFYNTYATKKTIAHGILNGALLSSNGTQLKLLLTKYGHDYLWIASLAIVSISIIGQITLFVLLAILSESHIANKAKRKTLNVINDCVLGLTGIIFALNIIANILV